MSTSPDELIAQHQGLVRALAWKIHRKLPKHVELDDLIAYGNVGLAEAARQFDASRGGRFTTYAYHRIRGAILDGLERMNWFRRADYHGGRYESLAQDFASTHGATPATEPAAATRDELEQEVRWLHRVSSGLAVVYLFCQQNEGRELSLEDSSAEAPSNRIIREETYTRLRQLINELPEPAATLIRATYFEGLTLKEAGERLGKSKSWASRLHAQALEFFARSLGAQTVRD